MELTVYRQSSKQRPDGTIVYKGEDARPYVDESVFFVADGLGGAAAIRHQQINPDLFDKEKLMDTLFNGVYDDYSDERFVKYVTDSFFELFAVKDCYTDNINNIKKSGYFASRIVTAILLHEMLYAKDGKPEELFKLYGSFESQQEKDAFLSNMGDYFAKKIGEDIRKIAKNANLIYESSYAGLALLGSTLCATIYHETEDGVEAFYLTAGDSRPYVWTQRDGLCQIIEDQEGKDGGMTNYIKANDDATFEIRCNYMSFPKPCILFNASDGCFDSGYFPSQMAFEKLILETAVSTQSAEQMGESIHAFFLDYGKHDDSSTIAMKMFGYDSFEALQEDASRRLAVLHDEYISKMPDLLKGDYVADYEQIAAKFPSRLAGMKSKFEGEDAVRDYCAERIKGGKYPPYDAQIQKVDEKINETRLQMERSAAHVKDIVARNYSRFSAILEHKTETWVEKRMVSKIQDIDEKHQRQADDFIALIEEYKTEFESTTDRLKRILEQMFEIGVPSDFSDYDDISSGVVEECVRSMDSLFDFFLSVKKKKQGAICKLTQLRNEYIKQNLKLAANNEESVRRICEMVISGEIDIEIAHTRILQDDFEELKQELAKIHDGEQAVATLNQEEKEKVFQTCQEAYWNERYVEVIEAIVSDHTIPISEGLRSEALSLMDEMKSQTDELKHKAELQADLFAKYDVVYGQYMGGSMT